MDFHLLRSIPEMPAFSQRSPFYVFSLNLPYNISFPLLFSHHSVPGGPRWMPFFAFSSKCRFFCPWAGICALRPIFKFPRLWIWCLTHVPPLIHPQASFWVQLKWCQCSINSLLKGQCCHHHFILVSFLLSPLRQWPQDTFSFHHRPYFELISGVSHQIWTIVYVVSLRWSLLEHQNPLYASLSQQTPRCWAIWSSEDLTEILAFQTPPSLGHWHAAVAHSRSLWLPCVNQFTAMGNEIWRPWHPFSWPSWASCPAHPVVTLWSVIYGQSWSPLPRRLLPDVRVCRVHNHLHCSLTGLMYGQCWFRACCSVLRRVPSLYIGLPVKHWSVCSIGQVNGRFGSISQPIGQCQNWPNNSLMPGWVLWLLDY